MNDKQLAEIICRALLAIVAALRKRYGLPVYKNVTLEIKDGDDVAGITDYDVVK